MTLILQGRKKAGKVTISLSGSLPHQNVKKSIIDPNVKKKSLTEGVTELVKKHFEDIESCVGNWKALFDLAAYYITQINSEDVDVDAKQAAQLALQSEAMESFFQKFSASLFTRYYPHSHTAFNTLNANNPILDLLAIPFDERRDSFPMKEEDSRVLPKWVYDNRQKLRDAFVSLLQECLPGRRWTERHLAGKAKELLFSKALHANGPWLAELFLGQFLKWYNVPRPSVSPSKMEMLEQRLQPKLTLPTLEECFEFFAVLLRTSDSLGLILALSKLVPKKISELEEQCCSGALRRNEMFRNAFFLLPGLVKIYSLLSELLQQPEKLIKAYLEDVLSNSKRKRSLFLHLKWALPNYTNFYEQSAFGHNQHSLLTIAGIKAQLEERSLQHVDTDLNLDVSFVLEEAFPHLNSKLALHNTASNIPLLPAPRKIQPVLSTSSNRSQPQSAVQKELRKWFWWQHPQEYELVKSITAYTKSTESGAECVEQSLKALLTKSLPLEVSHMVIKLALETLEE